MQTIATEEYEQKHALMAIYDPLGLLRYGAPELKRLYNRNLTIAFAISVALHLILLALFFFHSDDSDVPTPALTEVTLLPLEAPKTQPLVHLGDEGSSGALNKAPKGPAMRGDRQLAPDPFLQNKRHAVPDDAKTPKDMKPVAGRPVPSNNDASHTQPNAPLDKDSLKNLREHGSNGSVAGGAEGTGTHGVGGQGTGSPVDGMGTRGWAMRPDGSPMESMNASGIVTVRFTVLPNGEITNIVPTKRADPSLVQQAIARMRKARANPLPTSAPQVLQVSQYKFNFVLKQ